MKRCLSVLILLVGFAGTSWAATDADVSADVDDATQLQSGVEIEVDVDSAASPYADRQQLRQRIRAKVLSAVTEAIEDDSDLSDEDREEVAQALEALSGISDLEIDFDDDVGVGASVVAIIAIVMVFGMPIMIVAVVLYAGQRKRRVASDMASQFLASGQPVPPEVWQGLAGDASPRSNLHKGMMMMGVGVGVFLTFWLMDAEKAAYLALIPLFIGIAQLLIWKLEKSKASPGE